MSLKSIVKNGIGSGSSKRWISQSKSHVASDVTSIEPIQQGQWANLPPELLLDIIRRVEESETSWPERAVVVYCASVCKSWRSVTKEIIKNLQQCGKITFPISLKQPGPRDHLMKCFIRRIKGTSTFLLYLGSMLSKNKSSKFLLAAKRIKRAARIDFVISLAADDFSPASNKYVAIQKGGNAGLTPTSLPQIFDETICPSSALNQASAEPLILQNNAPMLWDDRSKSFQLVAAVDPSHNVSPAERKRIILQCGMIEKDIFVMDYSFPISAFEAFAICLTSM
ncbi:tubby-like F-box protein 5-like [Trifolium pratense]|uniref:Tubby-like F-box protein 5-like n=1 Tax=Trifolium pratense TaxID=57577 RepID=A0A2K3NQE2_TRIPR|nr:tubby-like F-box protein 5-like [Trifolium pratense]